MPESHKWHGILDVFGKKKKEETPREEAPTISLSEKTERAMLACLGEYTRLKELAITARGSGKTKAALDLLEQADVWLVKAEELHAATPADVDTIELDDIIKRYPVPETPPPTDTLLATTPEGKEIKFNLKEQLKYWGDFYRTKSINWVTLPETIHITPDQQTAMQELMTKGFDKLIIIPNNLVSAPTITSDSAGKPIAIANPRYEQLHQLMSQGYNPTITGTNYDQDGKFQGSKDTTTGLRIILTKDIQNLADDPLFKQTMNKSIVDLATDPQFKLYTGFSEASYLIYQREYFDRTKQHLDAKGYTWLPESPRALSGRVAHAYWHPDGGQLEFNSDARDYRYAALGSRLAGSFEII